MKSKKKAAAKRQQKAHLTPDMLKQGVSYDASRDDYVFRDKSRIAREEFASPGISDALTGADDSLALSSADFEAKHIKEKMSVWFDQDVLDEIRARAVARPGSKVSRLINDALRAVFLSEKPVVESRRIPPLEGNGLLETIAQHTADKLVESLLHSLSRPPASNELEHQLAQLSDLMKQVMASNALTKQG